MSDKYDIDFAKYLQYCDRSPSGLVWRIRDRSEFKSNRSCNIFHARYANKMAGTIRAAKIDGYSSWCLKMGDFYYRNSMVIYIMMIGDIPESMMVDHKDLNPLNNNIDNLRLATRSQNYANSSARQNTQLKVKGVTKKGFRFVARLMTNGKNLYLGTFDTAEEANEAYRIAATDIYGEFARAI